MLDGSVRVDYYYFGLGCWCFVALHVVGSSVRALHSRQALVRCTILVVDCSRIFGQAWRDKTKSQSSSRLRYVLFLPHGMCL